MSSAAIFMFPLCGEILDFVPEPGVGIEHLPFGSFDPECCGAAERAGKEAVDLVSGFVFKVVDCGAYRAAVGCVGVFGFHNSGSLCEVPARILRMVESDT